jgi:hypothetical protein
MTVPPRRAMRPTRPGGRPFRGTSGPIHLAEDLDHAPGGGRVRANHADTFVKLQHDHLELKKHCGDHKKLLRTYDLVINELTLKRALREQAATSNATVTPMSPHRSPIPDQSPLTNTSSQPAQAGHLRTLTWLLMARLSQLNRALTKIPSRAEKRDANALRETFVDSGVADLLDTVDHQILYGRRGTGKTHAVSYLVAEANAKGDVALNIDLRTVGSPDGLLDPDIAPLSQRATRLLVDVLGQVRDGLFEAVLDNEALFADDTFVNKLDDLLTAITNVEVRGEVELSREAETKEADKSGMSAKATLKAGPTLEATLSAERSAEGRDLRRETRRGAERLSLNFSDVARALRELAKALSSTRIWLVFDEWSSVPRDIQPYLAEFLNRCVLPLQSFTIKIAAIEQQSNFRTTTPGGEVVGLELGADVGAALNLDDFLVFEQNEDNAREFFANLLFKHLTAGTDEGLKVDGLNRPVDVIRLGFTDTRAFDELVRAAEGVPRDAIWITFQASTQARDSKISVPIIRAAARTWYQSDKARALNVDPRPQRLLNWLIDNVIRGKKARGFLVNERDTNDLLLLRLFDARVLHIVRRGYSAQDQPGDRFDVWVIDYGAYVDLIQTNYAPQGLLPIDVGDGQQDYIGLDVPVQDLRAIRRAVLDLNEFYVSEQA